MNLQYNKPSVAKKNCEEVQAKKQRRNRMTPEQLIARYAAPLDDWKSDFGSTCVHSTTERE